MTDCTFIKTPEEINRFRTNVNWMHDCEGIYAAWATDPEVLASVLPKPLAPVSPVVLTYIIEAKNPNFSVPYKEAALMTVVMNNGKPGLYTIAMMLNGSDNAVAMGRDVLSIPKKNAEDIYVRRVGDTVEAGCTRMGVDVIKINAEVGSFNDPACAKVFANRTPGEVTDSINFFYKFEIDQNEAGESIIRDVNILTARLQMKYHTWENASVDVALKPSVSDPWAQLACAKPLGGGWATFDLGLLGVLGTEPAPDVDDAISKLIAPRFDAQVYR